MRVGQGDGQDIMEVRGKAAKTGFVALEAMNVDEQQSTEPAVVRSRIGDQRLCRRGARIIRGHGSD
jgi:hypothetical protein